MHTRKTDEELLVQFVKDQGFDQQYLVEASKRLEKCIKSKLQDYAVV